ncbi:MAG: hypothetical protein KDC00_03605 [Flavobacteriales bacterium]|nr:hypothetical protein [Flavobacteriales bacterium]
MKASLLAIAMFCAPAMILHDFFISILTIRHHPSNATLDLTWQMTAHDVEHALSNLADLKLGAANEHPKADSLLNVYLHEHLVLQLAGKELEWIWIGRELESENLFCYLQVEGVAKADGLTVSNSLLQDVFDEQDNIVHLEANGRTLTKHFIRGVSTGTFATE